MQPTFGFEGKPRFPPSPLQLFPLLCVIWLVRISNGITPPKKKRKENDGQKKIKIHNVTKNREASGRGNKNRLAKIENKAFKF